MPKSYKLLLLKLNIVKQFNGLTPASSEPKIPSKCFHGIRWCCAFNKCLIIRITDVSKGLVRSFRFLYKNPPFYLHNYLSCYLAAHLILLLGIAGFVSANMYRKMGGESWVSNVNLTSALFTGLSLSVCVCSLACFVWVV